MKINPRVSDLKFEYWCFTPPIRNRLVRSNCTEDAQITTGNEERVGCYRLDSRNSSMRHWRREKGEKMNSFHFKRSSGARCKSCYSFVLIFWVKIARFLKIFSSGRSWGWEKWERKGVRGKKRVHEWESAGDLLGYTGAWELNCSSLGACGPNKDIGKYYFLDWIGLKWAGSV